MKLSPGKSAIQYSKLLIILLLISFSAKSQEIQKLSRAESEVVFLKENLLLIAEKLHISQAEAIVLQAKLWPNPTFGIDEVNLWTTQKQLKVFGDELQGFNGGKFGRNQQLALSVEQLILTAGKRKKLIALEQVSVDKSKEYFEELLRNLKIEFRNQLTNLQYLQFSKKIYQNQINSIRQLTQAYQKQVQQGNIAKNEYIRLKAFELEIAKNINDLNKEINEAQKELKVLMHLPYSTQLEITPDGFQKNTFLFENLVLNDLIEQAKKYRPDYRIAILDQVYYDNLYTYERSQRIPDLTVKAGYDRGGNFMYNFIGFGVSMDLPFFNRNQGNIRHAQIGKQQSEILTQQMNLNVENEIALAYQNVLNSISFFNEIEPGYEATLDDLLKSYTKNFLNRNISMLEYLDFMEAYLENKKIILEASKEVHEKIEELNYRAGRDVIE